MGLDIDKNSRGEHYLARGAPNNKGQIKGVWGDEVVDLAWRMSPDDRTLPNAADCRDSLVEDIFRDAPYDTEFQMVDPNRDDHWSSGDGGCRPAAAKGPNVQEGVDTHEQITVSGFEAFRGEAAVGQPRYSL